MVNLPQYGGENKNTYKGHKTDSKLPQHGGEGTLGTGGDSKLLKPQGEYCGPGRYLKKSK